MSIQVYLDLSTSHLTPVEMRAIDENSYSLLYGSGVIPHRYGAWVHVPPGDSAGNEARRVLTFPNLHACIVHARANNAMWINFDADGDIDPALPTFDW